MSTWNDVEMEGLGEDRGVVRSEEELHKEVELVDLAVGQMKPRDACAIEIGNRTGLAFKDVQDDRGGPVLILFQP